MAALRFYAVFCALLAAFGGALLVAACDDGGTAAAPSPDGGAKTNPPSRPITDPAPPPASDEAPKPTLTKLEPASVALGSIGPTIVLTGTGFLPRSVVQVDGEEIDTAFESETELSATIPTEKVRAVGKLAITVKTASPGGGKSEALDFAIENPPPTLIAITPLSIVAGSGDTTITVVGATFVKGSKILFGATALETTFKDDEHLEGIIPKAQLPTSKSVPVTVTTPGPGGGTTSKIAFVISNPGSSITAIAPTSVLLNAADFPIKVTGTGFVAGSKIIFNGTALATTPGGAGELTATVTTNDVSTAGDHTVSVENPPPGGGLSAPLNLVVNNPPPVTTSVDKTTVAAGTPTLPIVITGSGFVSTSKIMAKIGAAAPVALATQVPSGTQAKASFNAVQLAKVGNIMLTVKTDAPGGGESAPPLKIAVQPGAPKITAVEPATIPIASNDTPVTIKGTGFLANSTVTIKGQSVPATLAGTNLTTTVPATLLTALGTLPVIVTNPPDASVGGGGGVSPPVNITVACDQSNVNAILSDTTTTTTLDTKFLEAPALTRWANDGVCPNVPLASPVVTKQPARYAVVVNTNPGPVTLSAWADCPDGKGAAFLTFYRRATPPPTDGERLQCESFVAKGDPHLSPDANGSVNCPGLTKGNGGGITLNTCEKAVVHIQTFDITSTTFTAPPSLKIKADQ
ncbi:MAG: hypothetical protein U0270_17400 [Labilithrix sp.]